MVLWGLVYDLLDLSGSQGRLFSSLYLRSGNPLHRIGRKQLQSWTEMQRSATNVHVKWFNAYGKMLSWHGKGVFVFYEVLSELLAERNADSERRRGRKTSDDKTWILAQ